MRPYHLRAAGGQRGYAGEPLPVASARSRHRIVLIPYAVRRYQNVPRGSYIYTDHDREVGPDDGRSA